MRSELDVKQYNQSMTVQKNWGSFKLSLEKALEKHASENKINMNWQNKIPLSKKETVVSAEKKQRWKIFSEIKTKENYRIYDRGRNQVRRMTRQLTFEHEQERLNSVQPPPKKIFKPVIRK